MERFLIWLGLWKPEPPEEDLAWSTNMDRFAAAEDLLRHFRGGGQVEQQDLLCACVICQIDLDGYYDIIREHNLAFRLRHTAA